MASLWTNKRSIKQDLSLIQGVVPVDIQDVFASNERPSRLKLAEETEEQYYANCVGAGESNGPDFKSIQQYLNLVRNVDVAEIDQEEQVLEIIKRNTPNDETEVQPKQRKNRNAAVESIIALYGVNHNNNGDKVIEKVNGLKSPTFPKNMFKKKTNKTVTTPEPVLVQEKRSVDKPAVFVPSSFASETYQKYLETSQVKEKERNDIWSVVEKKIKDLDEQRKQKAALPSSSSSSSSKESINETTGLDFIYLPQHRHLTDKECVVCQVLCVKTEGERRKNETKETE